MIAATMVQAPVDAGGACPRPSGVLVPVEPGCGELSMPSPIIDRLPTFLKAGALLAQDTSGRDDVHAALLALCAQGAAIGPSHRLDHPVGGAFHHPTVDLLVADGAAAPMAAAAGELLAPIHRYAAKTAETFAGMTIRQIRARLCVAIERSAAIDREIDGMKKDAERLNAYHGRGEGPIGEQTTDLLRREPEIRARWTELQKAKAPARIDIAETRFALNPVVTTGGPAGSMLRRWAESTFDGHVIDQMDSAPAIGELLSRGKPAPGLLLGFLAGCASGRAAFAVGDRQFTGAGITLLWRCHGDHLPRLLGHPAMAEPALAARLLALPGNAGAAAGIDPAERDGIMAVWYDHLMPAFRWRLCGRKMTHRLADDALTPHRQFSAECAATAGREPDPRAASHIAALPGLALRVALGLRLGDGADDIREGLVTAGQHALAIELVRAASEAHMDALARCPAHQGHRDGGPEIEVELLLARLRVRGPCTRRDLARSFHGQSYDRIDGLLRSAMEQGRVLADGNRFIAAEPDGCQRVNASTEDR